MTTVPGVDYICFGDLVANGLYLVGKTTQSTRENLLRLSQVWDVENQHKHVQT